MIMKKILLTLFTLMFVAFTANAQSTITGDVNGDGTVSVNDVAMIVNHILGVVDDNFIIANADVNGDGEIDINDVMETVSIILEGEQDYPPLILSTTKIKAIYPYTIWLDDNGILSYDQEIKVSIESGSGDYVVESSNEQVASSYLEDSNVFITPLNIGQTIITVTDMKSGKTASIEVAIVRAYLSCPDDHHPHAIDLGLPSGTKWSCSNVDTDHPENQSPTNYGGYYAWGETYTKDLYNYQLAGYQHIYIDTIRDEYNSWLKNDIVSDKTYYYHLRNIGSDIAGTSYDVAHMKWGGSWVMPTHDQMEELIDNVIYISTTIDDVNGGLFISRINNKSIFLPYADFLERDKPANNKSGYSYYFTSTLYPRFTDDGVDHGITAAWGLCIYHNGDRNSEFQFGGEALSYELWRCGGFSVRPVCSGQ